MINKERRLFPSVRAHLHQFISDSDLESIRMASTASETVWSTMIAVRQLSTTYYTISTCLADILHRYREMITSGEHDVSSPLLNNLHQTLFSPPSTSNKLNDQSRLLAEYANVLHTILQ